MPDSTHMQHRVGAARHVFLLADTHMRMLSAVKTFAGSIEVTAASMLAKCAHLSAYKHKFCPETSLANLTRALTLALNPTPHHKC